MKKIANFKMSITRFILVAAIIVSGFLVVSGAAGAPGGGAGCLSNLAATEPALQTQICNSWNGIFPVIIVAVLLSFTIAAFFFVIGTVTKNDKIRAFGIGELYEAASTAIIVGFFLSITGLLIQTVPATFINGLGAAGGSTPTTTITDPYVIATGDIVNTVNTIQYEYDCVLNGNTQPGPPNNIKTCQFTAGANIGGAGNPTNFAFLSDVLSYGLTVTTPGGAVIQQVLNGGTALADLVLFAQQQLPEVSITAFLIDGLYVLWGLYYLLVFFSYISPVFIITGIVFRAILPTRSLGGMLIALGMGFYIVTPTLFAFLYSPNINPYATTLNINACSGASASPLCGDFGVILSVLNGLWLQVVFFPILVIAITYSFVTQLANFLGASSQMGGRLRLGFI